MKAPLILVSLILAASSASAVADEHALKAEQVDKLIRESYMNLKGRSLIVVNDLIVSSTDKSLLINGYTEEDKVKAGLGTVAPLKPESVIIYWNLANLPTRNDGTRIVKKGTTAVIQKAVPPTIDEKNFFLSAVELDPTGPIRRISCRADRPLTDAEFMGMLADVLSLNPAP